MNNDIIQKQLDIKTKTERKYYLDLLRIIAIFAVILTHVSADFVSNPNSLLDFTIGNIFDSLSRLGVPLFLMISGALVLDENKEFNCKKKVLYLLIPLFTWSFLYAFAYEVVLPIIQEEPLSLFAFLNAFITGHFHLWYMWAIIGLYLITPILRAFVKKENKRIVVYFIVLSLLLQFTQPILSLLFAEIDFMNKVSSIHTYILNNLNLDFLGGLTSYFLAGWVLANTDFNKRSSITFYILGGISLTCIIAFTQIFPNQYSLMYSNFGLLVFVYSISIFLLVKNLYLKKQNSKPFMIGLSNLSFGVYLIHMFILTVVAKILPNNSLYIPIIFLITTVISFIVSYIISKIPIAKKTIKT